MRVEGGSRVTSKLKQGAHIHQPTAWQLRHACAQPYQVAVATMAWHSRRSVKGENQCFLVFWRSEGRSAMPQGHKNEGSETKPTKRKNETNPTQEKQNRVTYRVQDPQNWRGHLHKQPSRQLH